VLRNFCRRASAQEDSSLPGDEHCVEDEGERMWIRTVARDEASAIPEARPRPA
jgi:hypothetical protein